MKTLATVVVSTAILCCVSPPAYAQEILSTSGAQVKGVPITDEAVGSQYGHMVLTKTSTDPQYGRSPDSPVRVGGGFPRGAHHTYRYLNSLLGPNGEKVHYTRVGTCCPFKTPNSPFGDTALLEVYEVTYEGAAKPQRLYFNWYDPGEALIPKGLTAVKD